MRRTHIVWDWNGTLFHDMEAVVAASNAAFATLGLAPLTLERYRELYEIPIPRFYQRLLGREPSPAEWEALDGTFHQRYLELSAVCGLTEGAAALLGDWRSAGHSQSLLSMYRHELLVPTVSALGIAQHFVRVDGRTDDAGGRKARLLARHLQALDGSLRRSRTVLIGDAVDDALAARTSGIHAVLYTGGSHSRAKLEAVGVPVVDSLAEAVRTAERMAGR